MPPHVLRPAYHNVQISGDVCSSSRTFSFDFHDAFINAVDGNYEIRVCQIILTHICKSADCINITRKK